MPTAVIVDAIRTPLGRRNGKLKDWHPVDLAAETLKALIDRTGVDPAIVDDVNKQFAQVEQIKKFALTGEEWLPDSEMLTPTSKLKRRGVNAAYAAEIEAMYSGLD